MPADKIRVSSSEDATENERREFILHPERAKYEVYAELTSQRETPVLSSGNEPFQQDTEEILDLAGSIYDNLSENEIDQVEKAIFGSDDWRSGSAPGE